MSLQELLEPFIWSKFSKKLKLRIETPYCIGIFTEQDAKERELFLSTSEIAKEEIPLKLQFYFLVDPQDGVIIDVRFQAFGGTSLIGAAEVAAEILVGKNYDQAKRMSADFIDNFVRDRSDIPSFPQEVHSILNFVVDAVEMAAEKCNGLPLAANYVAPPVMGHEIEIVEGGYPGFRELPLQQKLAVIEAVIAKEVRPYIELDAGGIQVLNIVNDKEVQIAYQGTCTSCHSATGATLSYIQQILRAKIDPELVVVPQM